MRKQPRHFRIASKDLELVVLDGIFIMSLTHQLGVEISVICMLLHDGIDISLSRMTTTCSSLIQCQ